MWRKQLGERPDRRCATSKEVERFVGQVDSLRDLERDGIVDRTAYDEMPPRVEYELTALGYTLREPLTVLGRWAEQHIEDVLSARESYDHRLAPVVLT